VRSAYHSTHIPPPEWPTRAVESNSRESSRRSSHATAVSR
jgi:hypothetical protein